MLSDHHCHQLLDLRSGCEEKQTPMFKDSNQNDDSPIPRLMRSHWSSPNGEQRRWSCAQETKEAVLTLHHGEGIFYLRFEQVDSHHSGQVLYIHFVDAGVELHLKQKPVGKNLHEQKNLEVEMMHR